MATEQKPGEGVEGTAQASGSPPEETSALQGLAAETDLPRRLREHPYTVLGIAAAAGYVLGGGLFSRITRPLARLAFGALLVPRLRAQAAEAIGGLRERISEAAQPARS